MPVPPKPSSPPSPNLLSRLPPWASRWLGYRPPPPPPLPIQPDYVIWIWSFIGAFGGLAIAQAIFTRSSYFVEKGVPPLVGSYGATAVLIYGVLDGPLAQPRALIGGHFIGALIGVIIAKLFGLLPPHRFVELQWLSSSLSCALAIVAMQMTGTTHPPAGATALLAILDDRIRALGWDLLWLILLTSGVVGAVGLFTNNVMRRWPVFWIAPPAPVPGTIRFTISRGGKDRGREEEDVVEVPPIMGTGTSVFLPPGDPTVLDAIHGGHANGHGHEHGNGHANGHAHQHGNGFLHHHGHQNGRAEV